MSQGIEKVIQALNQQREVLRSQIKAAQGKDPEVIDLKRQVEQAIQCLSWCQHYGILPGQVERITPLPATAAYSEFRLMDDCELDRRELWIEATIDTIPLRAKGGNLLIHKKHHKG